MTLEVTRSPEGWSYDPAGEWTYQRPGDDRDLAVAFMESTHLMGVRGPIGHRWTVRFHPDLGLTFRQGFHTEREMMEWATLQIMEHFLGQGDDDSPEAP